MILVGIKSCWKHQDRRQACRDTWLPSLPYPFPYAYKFVVGRHAPSRPFGPVTDSLYGEQDVLSFDVPDDFKNIGPKVIRMAQEAGNADAEYLVVMDDDTYLVPGRLESLIGRMREDSIDIAAYMRHHPTYPQGAMYVLGPAAFHIVADYPIKDALAIPDDVLVGKILCSHQELGHRLLTAYHTDNINPGPNWRSGNPDKKLNFIISTHKCLPADMRQVHAAWEAS